MAPTALSLGADGGVVGENFSPLTWGETAESGLGWPFLVGAQDVRGVESSSEPKLKKSLRSGDGSEVSIRWDSERGVSRKRRILWFSDEAPTSRTVFTDDDAEYLEPLLSGIRGGDLAVSCSSMISSRIRALFCLKASRSASSCFVTAMNRLLRSEDWRNSTEVGERGGVGCCDDWPDRTDDARFVDILSFLEECRVSFREEGVRDVLEVGGDQGPDNRAVEEEVSGMVRKGVP